MAIHFDEINDYYTIADDPSLTLPNSDWCVGTWTRVDDMSGAAFQYLISTGGYGVNPSINIYLDEFGSGKWWLNVNGTEISTTSVYTGDGVDRLLICQRRSGTLEIIVCDAFGSAVQEASGSLSAASDAGVWNIGRRTDGNVDRYYGGDAGEFFKGDFSLSLDEVTALGSGLKITSLGKVLDVYLPMESAEATLVDLIGSNDATRISVPTTVEHFTLYNGHPQHIDITSVISAIDLIVQDATHSHTPDNIDLIQTHILTIADALHSHTADNLILSIATDLVIADSTHSHIVENVVLTQDHQLLINDALHSLTSDNVDLTQNHILIVDDALHALISDNITLGIPTGVITPSERVYIIKAEDRVYIVAADDRIYTILDEDRTYSIH